MVEYSVPTWDSVKCGCGRRMKTADGGWHSYKKKITNITFRYVNVNVNVKSSKMLKE